MSYYTLDDLFKYQDICDISKKTLLCIFTCKFILSFIKHKSQISIKKNNLEHLQDKLTKISLYLDKFWSSLSSSIDKIKIDTLTRYQVYGSEIYTYPIHGCALIENKIHIGSMSPGFKTHIETYLNIYPEDINHPIINHSGSFKFMFGAYHPYNHQLLDYSGNTVTSKKINSELEYDDIYLIKKYREDLKNYLENYTSTKLMSFLINLNKNTRGYLEQLKKIDISCSS